MKRLLFIFLDSAILQGVFINHGYLTLSRDNNDCRFIGHRADVFTLAATVTEILINLRRVARCQADGTDMPQTFLPAIAAILALCGPAAGWVNLGCTDNRAFPVFASHKCVGFAHTDTGKIVAHHAGLPLRGDDRCAGGPFSFRRQHADGKVGTHGNARFTTGAC
jgi:hypothetical protein